MKFASQEIREKAVHAYLDEKIPAKELSRIFGYTVASICNWARAFRQKNQLAPLPNGHRKCCFTDEEQQQITILIGEKPDITLAEIREHFNKNCSLNAVFKTLRKLGFAFKKNSKGQRTKSRRHTTQKK